MLKLQPSLYLHTYLLCIVDILTSAWAWSSWSPCCACCTAPTPSPRTSSSCSSSWAWWWWLATGPGMSTSTLCLKTLQCSRTRWTETYCIRCIIYVCLWHYIFRLAKLVWSWPFCFVSCLCRSWCSTDTLSWREPPWPPPWRGRGGRSGAQTPQNIPQNMKTVSPIHGGIFNLNILHLITFFNRFWTSLMKVLLILLMIHTFKSKI